MAKVKSSLRSSTDQKAGATYSAEDQSLRSASKSESAYEDDFESISKSHVSVSASRINSRSGVRTSNSYSTQFENSANMPTEKPKTTTAAGKNSISKKRKSVEGAASEKYSPIKEAKDENSLEEDRQGSGDSEGDSDYTSVQNSESTLKNKYSNVMGVSASGSKSKHGGAIGIEDSLASSSYMMSSAGKDTGLKSKVQAAGGKTHINVGNVNMAAASKDSNRVGASSNLDETEEEDSESMSIS